MIIVSVKAPAPPARCLCLVAEATPLEEPVAVVKPPDASVLPSVLEVTGVEVKPADARSDISLGVSVSVTAR
jgi:hypothetical protein